MARIFILLLIWLSSTALLFYVYSLAPNVEGSEEIRFPRDLEDLKTLAQTMSRFRAENYYFTLLLFVLAFLYKQTFAIPGSFFMNILAGALFGSLIGIPLVCCLTAIGASYCFLLSRFFAQTIVENFFRNRLRRIRALVEEEKGRLLFFLLSARIFPFTPHWLLNILSPFVGIPLHLHFAAVGIGLIPYNFVCVRAGCILSEIRSISDVLDTSTLLELLFTAVVLLFLSKLTKRRRKNKEVN